MKGRRDGVYVVNTPAENIIEEPEGKITENYAGDNEPDSQLEDQDELSSKASSEFALKAC